MTRGLFIGAVFFIAFASQQAASAATFPASCGTPPDTTFEIPQLEWQSSCVHKLASDIELKVLDQCREEALKAGDIGGSGLSEDVYQCAAEKLSRILYKIK